MRAGIATGSNVFMPYDSETNAPLKGTVSVDLPSFELSTEEFKGAGLAGKVNVAFPGSMEPLTATLKYPVIYGDITKYMELGTVRTVDLRNEIIVQNPDSHAKEKVPNRWVLKGQLSGASPGSIEQASAGEATITIQLNYVQHFLDGDEILEWDAFKYIYKVNGKDLMAETRQNLLV
jgi:P2 family phage contractile tail tube protein